MLRPGLDHGFIAREGALERVPPAFEPVVGALKSAIAAAFGPGRLHGAYLYGSIPRGMAVPGVSDLDVLVVLNPRAGRGRPERRHRP
jgi:predicted nucleotidyltransferase